MISSRMNHVSHQIVASDPIAAASANQSVVSPFVHDLSTERAVRVLGPDGQAKATEKADPKQGGRNVGLEGVRKGKEPRASSRNAVEAKVSPAVVLLRRGVEKMATSFGLDLDTEAFLGRRDGRTVDAGAGQDPRNEIGFSLGASETSIDVVLIEAWPDARGKLLGLGQA